MTDTSREALLAAMPQLNHNNYTQDEVIALCDWANQAADMLEADTPAQQAQAVEPVAIHGFKASRSEKGDVFLEPTSLHIAPPAQQVAVPATGERADLIAVEASLRFNLAHYKEKVSELEDDLRELKTNLAKRTVERDIAISMAAGVEPQQVAVPDGWALVTTESLMGIKIRVNTLATLSLKAERYRVGREIKQNIADMLAAARGVKP